MTQVLNQSFRDWSIQHKFPFTDGSDMTCRDGRRVPLSAFIDITLCPDIEGTARITEITTDSIGFAIGGSWTATADLSDFRGGWIPVMRAGSCVGCVMPNADDLPYLKGMASILPLVFSEGHLELLPETVRGFCQASPTIIEPPTFGGEPSDGMTFSYGERFDTSGSSITVDTTPIYEDETTPILSIGVGKLPQGATIGSNEYPVSDSGALVIRTPDWCDSQFLSSDETLTFHQRGS